MRGFWIVLLAILVVTPGFANAEEGEKRYGNYFIGGYVNYEILEMQNQMESGDCGCDRCLYERYGDYPNMFNDNPNDNYGIEQCNGVREGWDLGQFFEYPHDGWRLFYAVSDDWEFMDDLMTCRQNYYEPYYGPYCTNGGGNTIPGAYKFTAAIHRYDLEDMICYYGPSICYEPYEEDWEMMEYVHYHLMSYDYSYRYHDASPWHKRFMIAAQLWVESFGDYSYYDKAEAKKIRDEKSRTKEFKDKVNGEKYYGAYFWARVMIHSLISWMSWEDGYYYDYHVLDDLNLREWYPDDYAVSTFNYQIWQHTQFIGDSYEYPVSVVPDNLPKSLNISAAPNPFNPKTTFTYSIPQETKVNVTVYDIKGRAVKVLEKNADKSAGTHTCVWDGTNSRGEAVPSGIYMAKLISKTGTKSFKVTLTK